MLWGTWKVYWYLTAWLLYHFDCSFPLYRTILKWKCSKYWRLYTCRESASNIKKKMLQQSWPSIDITTVRRQVPWTQHTVQKQTLVEGWFHVKARRKKGLCQNVTFLWRNMKEYIVFRLFFLILASIFFGTVLGFLNCLGSNIWPYKLIFCPQVEEKKCIAPKFIKNILLITRIWRKSVLQSGNWAH